MFSDSLIKRSEERQARIAVLREALRAEQRKQAMLREVELLKAANARAQLSKTAWFQFADPEVRSQAMGQNQAGQATQPQQTWGQWAGSWAPFKSMTNLQGELTVPWNDEAWMGNWESQGAQHFGADAAKGALSSLGESLGGLVGQGEWGKNNPLKTMGIAAGGLGALGLGAYGLANAFGGGGQQQQQYAPPAGAQPQYNQPDPNRHRRGYYG